MRGSIVLASTVVAAVVVVVACTTSYPACYRGEYRGCSCEAASGVVPARGYQACNVTEDDFQACVCDGTTPGRGGGVDASSPDATDAADASEGGAYLEACGASGTCSGTGAICFMFGSKGNVCTKRCTGPSDCPSPSPGCSPAMGVCRPP